MKKFSIVTPAAGNEDSIVEAIIEAINNGSNDLYCGAEIDDAESNLIENDDALYNEAEESFHVEVAVTITLRGNRPQTITWTPNKKK